MPSNRLLLTGATGFIGRHLTPLLPAKGYEVHGLHFGDAAPKAPTGCEYHRLPRQNLDAGYRRKAQDNAREKELGISYG